MDDVECWDTGSFELLIVVPFNLERRNFSRFEYEIVREVVLLAFEVNRATVWEFDPGNVTPRSVGIWPSKITDLYEVLLGIPP